MKISFNPQNNFASRPQFGIRLVEHENLGKYIDSFHFKTQQDNLKQAISLIKDYIQESPGNKNLIIGALHPSKADYVKNGTYDEYFIGPKSMFKTTNDRFERENIYMQLEGTDDIQGFYMNPDENPKNVASWFINTFNYYKVRINPKKS